MADTNGEEGGGMYVTKYGMASISRPNTIVVDNIEEWVDSLDAASSEQYAKNKDKNNSSPNSVVADVVDPPPADIPPGLLPQFAREAAICNLAMALEYRHPIKRRLTVLVLYNIGKFSFILFPLTFNSLYLILSFTFV